MYRYYDNLGKTLKIGDYIAYPVRQGSHMWMERGTIINFKEELNQYLRTIRYANLRKGDGSVVKFKSFWRCVKVQ